jgi:hypothetical protein
MSSPFFIHPQCNVRQVAELTRSRRDWITFGRALAMMVSAFLAGCALMAFIQCFP